MQAGWSLRPAIQLGSTPAHPPAVTCVIAAATQLNFTLHTHPAPPWFAVCHCCCLQGKGVDTIACISVNDAFVMDAWGKSVGAGDKVVMLADGNGQFAKALGVELDLTDKGLGVRSRRYALLADDQVGDQKDGKIGRLEGWKVGRLAG